MSLAQQIKPITYLKSNAAELVKAFATNPEPVIITQNGEAKMLVMDIVEYEKLQETMALLKLLALGKQASQPISVLRQPGKPQSKSPAIRFSCHTENSSGLNPKRIALPG